MNLAELVEHIRVYYLRDTEPPYLWPAKELIRYLNDAQKLFARHTHCITDETTVLTLDTTPSYKLPPSIVHVYEVYNDTGRRLARKNRQKLPITTYEGKPIHYTMDAGHSTIRFGPTPDGEYEFLLLTARLPLVEMKQRTDVPEIPEEYHLALCDYAAYMAVRNNDTEGSNTNAGANFREDWELKLRDAKRDSYHLRGGSNQQVVNNWVGGR